MTGVLADIRSLAGWAVGSVLAPATETILVPKRPSVLFMVEGPPTNPVPFYRGYLPARALQLQAWQAFVSADGIIGPQGKLGSAALDGPTEIVVLRRPVDEDGVTTLDLSEQILTAREAGQRVYVDVDDDYWHLPPTNPAIDVIKQDSLDAMATTIDAADGCLVSTPGLARAMRTIVNVPIHVCPNGTDPALYPAWEGEHDPLRIGWLGPWKWRQDDLASVADWLVPFLNSRPEVEFYHLGNMPSDAGKVEDILPGLEVPVNRIPWVPFPCLAQSLEQIDVLIIPQRRGGVYEAFADSRSPTSAMAAIACGVVVWATPIDSYRRVFGAALPVDLAPVVDDKRVRRTYRKMQRTLLSTVNLEATARAYEKVFVR